MHSPKAPLPQTRKRGLGEAQPETSLSPQPAAKRQKLQGHQRHHTPSSFWDNLSRLWLTRRALREFDRRTVWPTVPEPPHRTGKEVIDVAKLKRFARHGGPNLTDLRGYPEPEPFIHSPSNPTMDSSQSGSRKRARTGEGSATSSKSRKTSTYDRIFEQHLIDHGVYPEGYGDGSNLQEPYNLEEIQARLIRPRASLSPSSFTRQKFLDFKKENQQALTENGVMSGAFRTMAGEAKIPHQENLSFGNLKHLTDGSIVPAQPDFYDGTLPEALSTQIRDELKTFIIPSTNPAAPCLPNFFTEGKGPKGATDVCKLQATYDGALGARAMHQLRSYIDPETAYDNNAYTITSTYHPSGLLTLYTTHPVKSKKANRECEYHMTQLDSYAMTGNPDKFREGASALRNGRELMDAVRKDSIAAANPKALNAQSPGFGSSTQSLGTRSSNQPAHVDSETSADELALDLGVDSSIQRVAGGTGKKRPTNPSSNEYFKGKKRGP